MGALDRRSLLRIIGVGGVAGVGAAGMGAPSASAKPRTHCEARCRLQREPRLMLGESFAPEPHDQCQHGLAIPCHPRWVEFEQLLGRARSSDPDGAVSLYDAALALWQLALGGGTADGIAVWDLDPAHWIPAACRIAGRSLTREEWVTYLGLLEPYRQTCA
jgi:hypothetical protein